MIECLAHRVDSSPRYTADLWRGEDPASLLPASLLTVWKKFTKAPSKALKAPVDAFLRDLFNSAEHGYLDVREDGWVGWTELQAKFTKALEMYDIDIECVAVVLQVSLFEMMCQPSGLPASKDRGGRT